MCKYCNTLQHTATHCNTLQHTATHCNTLCGYRSLKSLAIWVYLSYLSVCEYFWISLSLAHLSSALYFSYLQLSISLTLAVPHLPYLSLSARWLCRSRIPLNCARALSLLRVCCYLVHTYIHVYTYQHACTHIHTCIHISICIRMHTYIHTSPSLLLLCCNHIQCV